MTTNDDIETIRIPIRPVLVLIAISLGLLGAIILWNYFQDLYMESRLKSLLLERTRRLTREQLFSISHMEKPILKRKDQFWLPADLQYLNLTVPQNLHGYTVTFDVTDLCIRNEECRAHFKDHYSKYEPMGHDWHRFFDYLKSDCETEFGIRTVDRRVQNSVIIQNDGYDFLEVCAAISR